MYQTRKSIGWFDRAKRVASAAVWVLIIGFIATWIYEYDACKWSSTSENPQVWCLITSLVSAYFTWWVVAVATFLKVVTVLL